MGTTDLSSQEVTKLLARYTRDNVYEASNVQNSHKLGTETFSYAEKCLLDYLPASSKYAYRSCSSCTAMYLAMAHCIQQHASEATSSTWALFINTQKFGMAMGYRQLNME